MSSFKDALIRTNSKPLHQVDTMKLTPQSMYYGTADYYKAKFGDRLLPDEHYEILELENALSMRHLEIDKNHIEIINNITSQTIYEFNRLMNEFKEREEEGKDDIPIENLNINPENYFVAK
jgi:hypothetical protein